MELAEFVSAAAEKFGVPGVAVGVWAGGEETYACHGATSIENPLPVDRDTLFVVGSVAKSFTATALMRLVADGRVDLDAPVRRYVPELRLADADAADSVTVLQLLNHTSGLDWRMAAETGDGDDALAAYVARLAEARMLGAPGERPSYSQVAYNLAGRILETVTGTSFERAMTDMVLTPLGLSHSVYTAAEAITHRFSVGHNLGADGVLAVARQWKDSRANNPGGGLVSSVTDLLCWARWHLGGREDGAVLDVHRRQRMQEPTVKLDASSLGDAIGIGWFLRDVDGVRTVGQGGSANGQFANLVFVPDRDVAVVVLSNAGPDAGLAFNQATIEWALRHYADLTERTPDPLPFDPAGVAFFVGDYTNDMMAVTIGTDDDGYTIACAIKPEIRANTTTELPPDLPPAGLSLLSDTEYLVTGGGLTGQRGRIVRDPAGTVTRIDLAGRSFTR